MLTLAEQWQMLLVFYSDRPRASDIDWLGNTGLDRLPAPRRGYYVTRSRAQARSLLRTMWSSKPTRNPTHRLGV
jgi:hypothetical protein